MTTNYYFEFIITQIENGYFKTSEFEEETLFMNIYYFYSFAKYLSPYSKWSELALRKLESNIRKQWIEKELTNVDYFIHLVKKQSVEIDPTNFLFYSENYFQILQYLKPIMDVMSDDFEKNKKNKKNVIRKPIR